MSRPNILILMADSWWGRSSGTGRRLLHAPHLKGWAGRSVRFIERLTASPLCAPARASFMSGQLPRRTRVYDNAAEFTSSVPTFAHHLRRAGYQTALSGKMHFVGPDQLHGLEQRLTTDIYPADFGWTPDYRKPGERIDWWYHNLGIGERRRGGGDHQPVRVRRRGRASRGAEALRPARGHDARPGA
jgi:choline-sulfatase